METITARYEDALKFVENLSIESFEKALEANKRSGFPIEFAAMAQGIKTIEYAKIIAFIYGKTVDEVNGDIDAMIEQLKGRLL